MKQILLPTDFSEYAWNAIFTALKLFSGETCQFYLLNVYEPHIENLVGLNVSSRAGTVYEAVDKASKKGLQKTIQALTYQNTSAEHQFETLSRPGALEENILEIIAEKDIDLVVMGTKGATGAKRIFLGSNSVKVLKKVAICPVLAVPREHDFKKLETVVFPTEFTHFFKKGSLGFLIELAKTWKSNIAVLHVAQQFMLTKTQERNKKILGNRLAGIGHSFHRETIKSTVANAITDFTEAVGADMIALVRYQHTFLEGLTQEPVVKKVAFSTKVPLLVLPE